VSLSSRWAGDTHRALQAEITTIQRLALALGPVRSVIRVIDDHVPPMAVNWAQVGKDDKGRSMSMSFTDFKNGRIAVNPLPVMEFGLVNPGKAIDISTGFAMHEAGHGQHSRDKYKALLTIEKRELHPDKEVPAFRPMRVAVYLLNLVEDVRIEDATAYDWPGFAPYFDAVLDWMWDEMRQTHTVPTTYGTSIADKLKVVFLACRYPNNVPDEFDEPDEIAWWQAWQANYLSETTDVRETIQLGLDHLGEDPETKAEMDEMGEAEKRDEHAGERVRAQIDRLMREGIPGTYDVCISDNGEMRPLTAEEAEGVDKLVREGLMVIEPVITTSGARCPEIRVSKPEETAESRAAYIGKPNATVEALRAALVFRQSLPRYDIKLQKSGDLDDTELYRWSMGDNRIFTERVIEGRPDVLMGLLVDLSGSMTWGTKLPTAQRLAQSMLWALHDQVGVTTRVWGHTGDGGANGSDIYRLWEPGDPLLRLGLIDTLYHGNNYDSFAINYCVSQMVDAPEPQKVLVVLSDGLPAGHEYGNRPAAKHVRQVTDWARRQGVQVLQIAIDESLQIEDQIEMFGVENVIPYTTDADLPKQLTKVMLRWT